MAETTRRAPDRNGPKRTVSAVKNGVDPRTGRFLAGNRIGPGRPPGSLPVKSRVRSYLGRELLEALARGDETLPGAFDRWQKLLTSDDERIRLEAEKFLHEVTNGRAVQSLQLTAGPGAGALILKWQEAAPPPALPAAEAITVPVLSPGEPEEGDQE